MKNEIKCILCYSKDVEILRNETKNGMYYLEVKCNYCEHQTLTSLHPKNNIIEPI